jgi:carbon storage regulator
MLVLSRKREESVVVVGHDRCEPMCTVTVLEIRGERVRLGFEAGSEVPIHRLEVWAQIQADGPAECRAGSRSPPAVKRRHALNLKGGMPRRPWGL